VKLEMCNTEHNRGWLLGHEPSVLATGVRARMPSGIGCYCCKYISIIDIIEQYSSTDCPGVPSGLGEIFDESESCTQRRSHGAERIHAC